MGDQLGRGIKNFEIWIKIMGMPEAIGKYWDRENNNYRHVVVTLLSPEDLEKIKKCEQFSDPSVWTHHSHDITTGVILLERHGEYTVDEKKEWIYTSTGDDDEFYYYREKSLYMIYSIGGIEVKEVITPFIEKKRKLKIYKEDG
jgi:hypothetical protein